MDNSVKVEFAGIPGENIDLLVGLLSDFPHNGLEEVDHSVNVYFGENHWDEQMEVELRELSIRTASSIKISIIPFENWNQSWEAGYDPVEIDDICRIYAPFHSAPDRKFENEIEIIPQMAFGTGHHETTEMMIRLMHKNSKEIRDRSVLDFGAGSGVLAIYAYQLGASNICANEIDPYAFENLKENTINNNADSIRVFCGGCEVLPEGIKYDIILANITRNVILDHLGFFRNNLNPGGKVLISGILSTDYELVKKVFLPYGFTSDSCLTKGKWGAALMVSDLS